MNRRSFLGRIGSVAVATIAPTPFYAAVPPRFPAGVGLQLITVMSSLEADFSGTLSSLAHTGYRQVETLGTCGHDAAWVRSVFDQCNLTSSSQHLVPKDLYKVYQLWNEGSLPISRAIEQLKPAYALENLQPMIEEGIARARIMGQRYLVWSNVADAQFASLQGVTQLIHAFNTAGALCAKEGLTFAFHNGSKSFTRVGNDVAYDLILDNTDPHHVKMELDTYYATRSGAHPVEYLEKHPGRFKLVHLKDMDSAGEIADVGKGTIDFAPLLEASMSSGVEQFFVEHDRPANPLQSARECFQYLESLTARKLS